MTTHEIRNRERARRFAVAFVILLCAFASRASILWSDLGATLVHESGPGSDILGGAVKRDDSAADVLYFKFHVDPLSDFSTEEYFAGFQLFEGDAERLGVGNSLRAWAYSAYNTADKGDMNNWPGDFDLRTLRTERGATNNILPYELPRRGVERTIVFKVKYVPGGDDEVTAWLNPDLAAGATEASQPEVATTSFRANASFDQIRIRHGGGGPGWTFSDMAIATAFSDFVAPSGLESGQTAPRLGPGAGAFSFRAWQREQGLPQNSVHAIAQTRDGYLWVGTDDGLARFDGARFVPIGSREGLRSGPVSKLFEDSRNALWIGSSAGGLTRWSQGQFTTFTVRDGLPADSITAIGEDREGRLWVGTEAGLVIGQDGKWSPSTEALRGRAVTTIFRDRRGGMWVAARGTGVFQYIEGKFISVTDPTVDELLKDPHCLLVDAKDRLWVGAGDDFVLTREEGQWRRYRIPRHLARPYISSLAEAADGTIWAGSVSEGLFQFKEGKLGVITAGTGLLDNFIESLLADHEGNLWVGTGAGLNQLRPRDVFVFGPNEGLGYGPVQGLAELAPGIVWAGKPSDGLYRWEGRNFNRLDPIGLPRNDPQVNALLTAWDGTCWMAGGHGLLHFRNPKLVPADVDAPLLTHLNITSIAEDNDGYVWAGTREGQVWRVRSGTAIAQTNLWQERAIMSIVPEKDGTVWVATEGGGLTRFRNGNRTHYGKDHGLLSDLVRALHLDSDGTLWIGTIGGGLSRLRQEQINNFTTREGLPDDTISQILEDDNGRLWLGSNRGLASVSKRELDDLVSGKITSVVPQVYGRAEGMVSEECTGGFCPAGLKSKTGMLWFPTLKGIVVVDPRPKTNDIPAPTVVLEEVLVDGVAMAVSLTHSLTPLRVPPGKHRLDFRYTALSFSAPERIRFRYRLEGLDPRWSEGGASRTASYPYVPAGEYTFHVIACNRNGVWTEQGASIRLVVMAHFWQAGWFIGVVAIGLIGTVAGATRVLEKRKLHRQLQRAEQERALERERARIAQDLHDDLGSSLTRISLLSDLAKADKDSPVQVEAHVDKISQSAAQTVRALEEIVWAVRPGSDSLQSLVEYISHFANEMFESGPIRCRLDLPQELPARMLPPEVRHNIFLIVKEALTNALKHSGAREVHVRATASDTRLGIIVQDDGNGFEVQPQDGHRHGLDNMRRRAKAIGAELELVAAPQKGTTVRLLAPLPSTL
jgi:ligand-binding sensor domain-containing protein/signal transduction histidine kinase